MLSEGEPRCHPLARWCHYLSKDRGGEGGEGGEGWGLGVGAGGRERERTDRKQEKRAGEREKRKSRGGVGAMEITTNKAPSADFPLGHSSSPEKPPSNRTPHSSLSQFPSSTHNFTLHWFALQCGRQATTCESNYSYRERPRERKGGRDRGAGNHASRLCLCEERK